MSGFISIEARNAPPEMLCALDAVAEKLSDVDERVRTAACKLFGGLDYEIALHHVDVSTLRIVGERLKDKKVRDSSCAFSRILKRHPTPQFNSHQSAVPPPKALHGSMARLTPKCEMRSCR